MNSVKASRRKIKIGFKGLSSTVDEKVMGWEYSPCSCNFRFRDGILAGGMGVDAAKGYMGDNYAVRRAYPELPEGIAVKGVFTYLRREGSNYDDRIVVQTAEGKLYYTAIFAVDTWHEVEGYTLTGDATAVNYNYNGRDVLLMSSESSVLAVLDDDTVTQAESAPRFSSLAVHYERIFGTHNGSANSVWFSDDFDPSNWTVSTEEAGYIEFADDMGDALAVISFAGYLYVFREHGIYRLTAYGDQTEFSLNKLFTGTGRIYKNTITFCGDRIVFLSQDGLYSFDGYGAKRIAEEMPELVYPDTAAGAYRRGSYYLACITELRKPIAAGFVNNTLLRYDFRDGNIDMMGGYDFTVLASVRAHRADDLIAVIGGGTEGKLGMISDSGEVFGTPTEKTYYGPVNDLGSELVKTLRSVTLTTERSLSVAVIADGKRHVYGLKGSPLPQTVNTDVCGRRLGIELTAVTSEAEITPLTAVVDFT